MTAQHILVPTDFSEYADYALDYAIELAKTFQARLTVLYVLHLSSLALGEAPPLGYREFDSCSLTPSLRQCQCGIDSQCQSP